MIEVKNITKRYGNHVAVDNLSFQVEKGMIYGFLGPNGAGKSTTMNIMTGYIAATDGTVEINGYDILKEPEKAKKCIGYLPELPPVYPDMTVEEYLIFVAEIKQVKKAERRDQIASIMEQTQIAEVKGRLIRNLSKGYKQRVGLAQAIVGYPEVIILDEPTVGLDPKQIIEMRELIKTLSEKHTIILSSHILSEVSAVCDHIMIISKGKLAASDTPEGLMTLLKGGKQLEISVLGEQERFEKILSEIEDIENYKIAADTNKKELHGVVRFGADKDIRKELFYRLAASDMPIMSLGLSEKSLEDVFLALTEEETAHDSDI
ncbi:MAG: ABC transporter ATP-binding protein [Lachnospiraceae bacterium]|nr:ABC transporter ATP-binding protein [Lachnospiraceae bacterium]MCI9400087.1 ABC transporter ATP-binding protein [Lachnospiraceae bacterium]MCX4378954.1 ABC transporter ATP-binding protein [Lachnospiraceae bacterium]